MRSCSAHRSKVWLHGVLRSLYGPRCFVHGVLLSPTLSVRFLLCEFIIAWCIYLDVIYDLVTFYNADFDESLWNALNAQKVLCLVRVWDETDTVLCPKLLVYSAPDEDKVGVYFFYSLFLLSGVCNSQDRDLTLVHELYYFRFLVSQTTNVPGSYMPSSVFQSRFFSVLISPFISPLIVLSN